MLSSILEFRLDRKTINSKVFRFALAICLVPGVSPHPLTRSPSGAYLTISPTKIEPMTSYSSNSFMVQVRDKYPHQLNREILSRSPCEHPDIPEWLDRLGATLPTECRVWEDCSEDMGITDYRLCQFLVHEGIVFAAGRGTYLLLRLPENIRMEAQADQREKSDKEEELSPEWLDIRKIKGIKREELVRLAYEYAAELSKIPLLIMTIISCEYCSQKLRVPSNRGELVVTCPRCKHSWHYQKY